MCCPRIPTCRIQIRRFSKVVTVRHAQFGQTQVEIEWNVVSQMEHTHVPWSTDDNTRIRPAGGYGLKPPLAAKMDAMLSKSSLGRRQKSTMPLLFSPLGRPQLTFT